MDAEKVEMVTEWMNNYSQKRKLKKLRQQDRQMAAQNARRMQQSVHEFYMGVVVLQSDTSPASIVFSQFLYQMLKAKVLSLHPELDNRP